MATERRKKPTFKDQLQTYWYLYLFAGVIYVGSHFLIKYGVAVPTARAEIETYHSGFTNEDGIIIKIELVYIKERLQKLDETSQAILKLLLEGGNDNNFPDLVSDRIFATRYDTEQYDFIQDIRFLDHPDSWRYTTHR